MTRRRSTIAALLLGGLLTAWIYVGYLADVKASRNLAEARAEVARLREVLYGPWRQTQIAWEHEEPGLRPKVADAWVTTGAFWMSGTSILIGTTSSTTLMREVARGQIGEAP